MVEAIPWQLFLAEQLAKWLAVVIALASALSAKYIVQNFMAGIRLKGFGFEYNNNFKFRGMQCSVVNIGRLKTIIKNTEGETSSPISNELFEKEIIWMSDSTTGNVLNRRSTDNKDS